MLLTACNNNQVETLFAPDPELQQNPQTLNTATPTPNQNLKLPPEFPAKIPIYPEAKLITIEPELTTQKGQTKWESQDISNLIFNYYQQELTSNNWQIKIDEDNNNITATQNDLQIEIDLIPSSNKTEVIIAYQQTQQPSPPPPQTTENSPTETIELTDLAEITETEQKYIQDLAKLGVFGSEISKFEPNKTITRREFARWLLKANNRLYTNIPGKQIRLANKAATPIFKDIANTDPDFAIIQGLAEAGLIPSTLTNDSTAILFQPDAPLTREDLISWKVPLDTRRRLPQASLDTIKETWGFQDAAEIEPRGWRALYVDYQNGEQSNIKRVFGYTTLFQPKKPVTRLQAAIAIWYFGYQGEGITAQQALSGI